MFQKQVVENIKTHTSCRFNSSFFFFNRAQTAVTVHEDLHAYLLVSRSLRRKYKIYGTARDAEETIDLNTMQRTLKCSFLWRKIRHQDKGIAA
jgi:3-methyladenine DNA glycosylase Tag